MALPIAVLISGSGSNLQSIIDKIEQKVLHAEIKVVISNKPDAYGLTRAKKHNLRTEVIEHQNFSSREDFDQAMVRVIKDAGAEAVILAGFMRILTPAFIQAFPNKILNIHPAILPSFPGVRVQAQAADYGVRFSGCTVHFVDEKMDNGPIIIQAVVPAYVSDDGQSLGQRILNWEHRIYPQAIEWLAQGRLKIVGRKVEVRDCPPVFVQADETAPAFVNPGLEPGF